MLAARDGVGIAHDDIGNLVNDGTWTYTWQHGKQLASMTRIVGNETVSFEYNEDGLRTKKTVTNGEGTVITEYVLHGKNIVHMTRGTDEMHFFYGADDKPAIVDFNGTSYRYLYTLQGDVIGLVDENGAWVVAYRFDAWGKPLGIGGSLANTLGVLQPFRYRGYVFDEETGDYYLRSRYYRPDWGRFVSADGRICRSIYGYCNNDPIMFQDEDGDKGEPIIEDIMVDDDETYGMSPSFALNHWPKIAKFFESPSDYRYNPRGYRRIGMRKNGSIRPGSIACAHLMYEITGHGSKTARYRYSQAKRLGIRSGALFDKNGELLVDLQEGMEVYKPSYYRDEDGNLIKVENGHVGMLIRYDFGDGPEWAVVQSASTKITKCKSNWESDPGGGPVITSFRQLDGKYAWVNFTDPRWDK